MQIKIEITSLQHIKKLTFEFSATPGDMMCITGRNGVGKTTLIKSIRNLSRNDTFINQNNHHSINQNTYIKYTIDTQEFLYRFDENSFGQGKSGLNCRTPIPPNIKNSIDTELSFPYGNRFTFFEKILSFDEEIRQSFVLGTYSQPTRLIEILNDIYSTEKFNALKEVKSKNNLVCYWMKSEDNRYIREDNFSSGEYFLINLYKKIISGKKIIAIDEIEISLDPAAQTKLVKWLRILSSTYEFFTIFTTHSLAVIQTLNDGEIFLMEDINNSTRITETSINYAKSILFGFNGWDRYILTEDEMLESFITKIISHCNITPRFKHIIIYAGGGDQVNDLKERNKQLGFFAPHENVAAIYDGDQRGKRFATDKLSICIPFESIEKKIFEDHQKDSFPLPKLTNPIHYPNPKALFGNLAKINKISREQIFDYLIKTYPDELIGLANFLQHFLE